MDHSDTRLPHLDAARFLAFVPVFFHHFVNQLSWPEVLKQRFSIGIIGLDFFFVLSGFILSQRYLTGESAQGKKYIVFGYLLKRIGRTWPLYILWFLMGLCCRFFHLTTSQTGGLIHWLSFSLNFEMIQDAKTFWFPTAVLWSICVEEQFYLLISLLLLAPRFTPIAGMMMVLGSLAFRAGSSENELYFHTLSYAGNFGIGLMIPFLSTNLKEKLSSNYIAFMACILLAFCSIKFQEWFQSGTALIFEPFIFSGLFMLFILNWTFNEEPLFMPGKIKWMSFMGQRSLGLYLFHTVAIILTFKVLDHDRVARDLSAFFCSLGLTLLMTYISFRYFESPLNKLIRGLNTKWPKKD